MEDEEFKKNLDEIIATLEMIKWKAIKRLEKAQELKEYLEKYKPDQDESYEAGKKYQK